MNTWAFTCLGSSISKNHLNRLFMSFFVVVFFNSGFHFTPLRSVLISHTFVCCLWCPSQYSNGWLDGFKALLSVNSYSLSDCEALMTICSCHKSNGTCICKCNTLNMQTQWMLFVKRKFKTHCVCIWLPVFGISKGPCQELPESNCFRTENWEKISFIRVQPFLNMFS